jgi:phosphate transport system permease protein
MAAEALARPPAPQASIPRRSSIASWPLADRAGYVLCWVTGVGLCLLALGIVAYMLVKGVAYLKLSQFVQSPSPSLHQTQSGGFSDPILGTLLVTGIGTLLAAPTGVALAAWLSEYARPAWLARTVESALEMMAGVPSVVLAIFGLLVFSEGFIGFLSEKAFNGTVTGQSFITAGAVMSFLALPLIVASTREGLAQLPDRLREASYALGKTRATTIRRVLLPAVRPNIASGVVLGMGRIVGDTAIITLILGATLKNEAADGTPVLGALRGTGSTLTSYVYNNSPAGEGNSHEKAYAAAFVLLMIVLALNALVTVLTGGRREGERRRTPLRSRSPSLPWTR